MKSFTEYQQVDELFGRKKKLSPTQQKKVEAKERNLEGIRTSIANIQQRQNEIQTLLTPREQGGKGVFAYSMHGRNLVDERRELRRQYKKARKEYSQAKRDLRSLKKGEPPHSP